MTRSPPYRVARKRQRRPTEASEKLVAARAAARLQLRQLAAALDVHPRTVRRWEIGESHPSPSQWTKLTMYLARLVPEQAVALAAAAGVPSPVAAPPSVDERRIEAGILRAADLLDVSPRRIRAAVREIARATLAAHGTLADLARAAEDKTPAPHDDDPGTA